MMCRKLKKVIPALFVVAAMMLSAAPALAYYSGQTVWSQTKSTYNGVRTMSNFDVDDSRPYDLNGQLTTDCTVRYWGFRVVQVKNFLPDPTELEVNWGTPVKSCSAIGGRRSLSSSATAYHFDVKADGAGAQFYAYVIAR